MIVFTRVARPATALVLLLAACGGGGGGANEGTEDLPNEATVAAADAPATVQLRPGRYRLTIDEECETYNFTITQGDGFSYERSTSATRFFFVSDVPGGDFVVDQTDAGCTDWEIELVWVSG